ncbi:serine/threonine-protein kinase [Metarhizium album ARSEF 1941]|uniref:Serine/threonine-protein kinase n=1 Tax=Metarhizium album (strain ARSEF 1941) TaxID=1081103 RepID=A0A0B2X1A7_METAS|nr:serine/threonine-protein kinase [Metarhizium album ARSEF 1941]KHN98860.1 serine/threonine-protein kinase [Metarhizium album ARSEF 1941]
MANHGLKARLRLLALDDGNSSERKPKAEARSGAPNLAQSQSPSSRSIRRGAGRGELYKHLRKAHQFPKPKAARYIAQMASALRYFHRKHIIRRNIKPENIPVGTYGEMKISDFGWSVHSPRGRRRTYCGTLDCLPPEMVIPNSPEKSYDEEVGL